MGQGINQIIKLFPHEKLGQMMPRGPPQAWDAWDEFRVEMPMWKTDWRTGAGQMWMDQALDESNIERIFWGETEGYAAEFSSIVKLSDFFFAMLLVSWHMYHVTNEFLGNVWKELPGTHLQMVFKAVSTHSAPNMLVVNACAFHILSPWTLVGKYVQNERPSSALPLWLAAGRTTW